MTFQDLRSGRCSTTCTPTTSKARENFQSCKHIASLQLIIVDGTSHLHRYFIKLNSLNFSAKQSKLDTMKASVPKLFDCPGSAGAFPLRNGWRCGLATACETYNTVGSLPLGLVSTSKHYKLTLFMLRSCAPGFRLPRSPKT